jgi:hypothetical protein
MLLRVPLKIRLRESEGLQVQIRVPEALSWSLSGRYTDRVHPNQLHKDRNITVRQVYMMKRTKISQVVDSSENRTCI